LGGALRRRAEVKRIGENDGWRGATRIIGVDVSKPELGRAHCIRRNGLQSGEAISRKAKLIHFRARKCVNPAEAAELSPISVRKTGTDGNITSRGRALVDAEGISVSQVVNHVNKCESI